MTLNRVTLLGNLGQDPDYRTISNGNGVCRLSIATTDRYKKDDEWQELTDWHNVVCWGKLADFANEYLQKGAKVYIEGKQKTRSYEKDGETKYIAEVVASVVIPADKKEKPKEKPTEEMIKDNEDVPF